MARVTKMTTARLGHHHISWLRDLAVAEGNQDLARACEVAAAGSGMGYSTRQIQEAQRAAVAEINRRTGYDRISRTRAAKAGIATSGKKLEAEVVSYLASTNIPTPAEDTRLDDLTAVTSTILNHCRGQDLDDALAGEVKRRGRSDDAFRQAALSSTHPDDLIRTLVHNGYTLSRFGIESVARSNG